MEQPMWKKTLILFFMPILILASILINPAPTYAFILDDDMQDPYFESNSLVNGPIVATLVQPDGKIVLGGSFSTYLGETNNLIVRLNSDGTLDNTFDTGDGLKCADVSLFQSINPQGATGDECGVYTLELQSDGKILAGGYFNIVDGISNLHRNITRFNTDGSIDSTFNPGGSGVGYIDDGDLRGDGAIFDIEILDSGKILIGGSGALDGYNELFVDNGLIRLNADGTIDNTFNAGGSDTWVMGEGEGGVWGNVEVIRELNNGQILIAGSFSSYMDGIRSYPNGIARLNADGTLDSTFQSNGDEIDYEFNPGEQGTDGIIYDMIVLSDGKIIIGGQFDNYSHSPIYNLARLNSNGTLDTSFNNPPVTFGCPLGVDYYGCNIADLKLLPSGKLLAGGKFTSFGSNYAVNLVRLNSDGSLDEGFIANTGDGSASDRILDMALQTDGKVLLGGIFAEYNGDEADNITRLGYEDSGYIGIATTTPTPTPTSTPLPTNVPTRTPVPTNPPVRNVVYTSPNPTPITTLIPTPSYKIPLTPKISTTPWIINASSSPTPTIEQEVISTTDLSWLWCCCLLLLFLFIFLLIIWGKEKKKKEEEEEARMKIMKTQKEKTLRYTDRL